MSIEPVGTWLPEAERQMREIEAAVRRELDEAAAAMDAAEPVGDATIRHRRQLGRMSTGGSPSAQADERLLYAATHGSRNHRQVAERLNAHAAELEKAQLQLVPEAERTGSRPVQGTPEDSQAAAKK